MQIDKLAVWINTIGYRSADLVAFARRLEQWGYGTRWINDGMGSDPMVLAARILQFARVATHLPSLSEIRCEAGRRGGPCLTVTTGRRLAN